MKITSSLLILSALCCSACGGGGGSSPSTFNLLFEAPPGSGSASTELSKVKYSASSRDVTLATGVSVSGLVTDGGGAPLGGVDVSLRSKENGSEIDSDTTDGAGMYALDVGAGTYIACLDSNTGALGEMTVGGVAVGAGPVVQNFQFPSAVIVSGTVFDSLAAGVNAAQVDFTGLETGATVAAVTNGMGFYSVALVPDTYEAIVDPVAGAATHLKERFAGIVVAGATPLDFGLTEGVQVSGIVLTSIGTPLTDTTDIDIVLPENSEFFAPSGVTSNGIDGSYSIGPVPPLKVTFRIEPDADTGFPRQDINRNIAGPGVQIEDLMLKAGVLVTGVILWDDGFTPADNCEVQPVPQSKKIVLPEDEDTNGAGFYELSLFPGTYEFQLTPDDPDDLQLPEVLSIDVTGPLPMVVNVTLTRGAMLMGTVFQPDGLTPEQDIRVEIAGVPDASDVSDGSGDYMFLAPVGTHELTLVAEDGSFEYVALDPLPGVVVTIPGPVTQDVTLVLSTAGRTILGGIVYEDDGVTPAVGSDITARSNKTGAILATTTSVAGGVYQLVIP